MWLSFDPFSPCLRISRRLAGKKILTAVGFEPTRIAPPELESGALDRSAKLSPAAGEEGLPQRRDPTEVQGALHVEGQPKE